MEFPRATWPLGTPEDDMQAYEGDDDSAHGDEGGVERQQRPLLFQVNPRSSIVTRTLECGGLRPTARADYNVLWQKKFLNPFQMRSLHPQQRVNHFPGMNFLTHKDQLVHTVRAASARAVKAGHPEAAADRFLPTTWLLPDEMDALETAWKDGRVLILKFGISARGEGIQLTSNLEDVRAASAAAAAEGVTLVASVYVTSPYIVPAGPTGRKFDLRLYVCVTCMDPLRAYWHTEGLARFASSPYQLNKDNLSDRAVHLTNYTVNKVPSKIEPEPELEPEHDFGAGGITQTLSQEARESRLAAMNTPTAAAAKVSDDGDGAATGSGSLATDLKWQLRELEHHMVHQRGVTAEAIGEMWKEVALLIRGTLVRQSTLRAHVACMSSVCIIASDESLPDKLSALSMCMAVCAPSYFIRACLAQSLSTTVD